MSRSSISFKDILIWTPNSSNRNIGQIFLYCLILLMLTSCSTVDKAVRKRQTERELKRAMAELNLRNSVGFLEFCARRNYITAKTIKAHRNRFDNGNFHTEEQLIYSQTVYKKGLAGELLYFLMKKQKPSWNTNAQGSNQKASAAGFTEKIKVRFSHLESRNGELAVYCQQLERNLQEGIGVFSFKKQPEEPIEKDYHGYSSRR